MSSFSKIAAFAVFTVIALYAAAHGDESDRAGKQKCIVRITWTTPDAVTFRDVEVEIPAPSSKFPKILPYDSADAKAVGTFSCHVLSLNGEKWARPPAGIDWLFQVEKTTDGKFYVEIGGSPFNSVRPKRGADPVKLCEAMVLKEFPNSLARLLEGMRKHEASRKS